MDRIATYYNKKNETQRLFSGRGELEFLRTKQIIEQFLPDETGLSIVDVGGGSGPYAFWLAEKGHKVALFDLMPNHVEEAVSINEKAPNPLTRIETADVRSLELESQQYDVVLLLGPMYHLTDADERSLVLRKVADWLSPNGVGYVAYIAVLNDLRGFVVFSILLLRFPMLRLFQEFFYGFGFVVIGVYR